MKWYTKALLALLLLTFPVAAPAQAQSAMISADAKPDQILHPATNVRPEEQMFADLARTAPSSAGFYYDSTGNIVVRVRDAVHSAAAIDSVRGFAASHRLQGPGGEKRTNAVKVAPAQYTFWQLAAWRDIAFDQVLGKMPGVTWLDLDEMRNRVTLGITADHFANMQGPVRRKLRSLGVDPGAVAFKKVGTHTYDQQTFNPPSTINQQTSDPIAGGLEIHIQHNDGSLSGCTNGFVAQRDGIVGIVSNSHCTTFMFNPDTDPVFQLEWRQIATA